MMKMTMTIVMIPIMMIPIMMIMMMILIATLPILITMLPRRR